MGKKKRTNKLNLEIKSKQMLQTENMEQKHR